MTQQEGKNDIIADENTPLRSAAGVAVAKAAVRDVRTVINKYIVVIFPSAGPRFFSPSVPLPSFFLPRRLNFLLFLSLPPVSLLY